MAHKPIQFKNLSLSFSQKTCFENFSTQIHFGNRIAIIGGNGAGKSSLLKILLGELSPSNGAIHLPQEVRVAYVPQIIEEFESLSGGQRLNAKLTQALSCDPNVLLLDEPTNHLDSHNRKSLIRMLQSYQGTLIIISHDVQLLRNCIDTLWHIDQNAIHIFSGNYDDYLRERHNKRVSIEEQLLQLSRQKKSMHDALMKEQVRAANSRKKGEKSIDKKKWPTIVSKSKALSAQKTSGQKKASIENKKQTLTDRLSELRLPEIIKPQFNISAPGISDKTLLSVRDGHVGYSAEWILKKFSLSLRAHDRVAIMGKNGSGKSTLIKAILQNKYVLRSGEWFTPKTEAIGYLDQHYQTLIPELSVLDNLARLVPDWTMTKLRRHLNDFLFHGDHVVHTQVSLLSGGEKARLTLAGIAALTPPLLILDEVTNNLDIETRDHMIQVLENYPGAMIVISHDENFLQSIRINDYYRIDGDQLFLFFN
jgi:ATPase subunit of ABC transporter with duplicated ATPase domains